MALLAARPLVLGEDPGLRDPVLAGTSGLTLSMLWFVVAAGWAAWRAAYRQGGRIFGPVELALAAVVLFVFLSVYLSAHYKHPALLIACEWLLLFLVFCLVRQLTNRPEDLHGLMAVLVASGVSLSVHAIYQALVDLPELRALAAHPEELVKQLAKINEFLAPDDPRLEIWKQRFEQDNVFATFAHPNAFAGFLALLVPVALGWALAAGRQLGKDWRALGACACALLMAVALWLTHSRGAILGTILAGGAALVVSTWRFWWPRKVWVLGGLAGLALIGMIAGKTGGREVIGKATRSFGLRTEYWAATWSMIRDHVWWGVGPGNFGRIYSRYMAADAYEMVSDPHNFALELWATSGLLAMLALLTAVAFFFWRVIRLWFATAAERADPLPFALHSSPAAFPRRWELYLGGMAGLLLGFLLRAGEMSTDQLKIETGLSLLRSVVWFAALAILSGIAWTGRSRTLALAAGVGALLLNLGISGGIAWPSVAQPLWVMAALAMVSAKMGVMPGPGAGPASTQYSVLSTQYSAAASSRSASAGALSVLSTPYSVLSRLLPLPVLAGIAVVYFLFIFLPVNRCATSVALAHSHYGDGDSPGWRSGKLALYAGAVCKRQWRNYLG